MQVSAVTRAPHLPKDVATGVYARTCIQARGYVDVNPTLLTPIVAQPTERTQEAPETGNMKLERRKLPRSNLSDYPVRRSFQTDQLLAE